MLSARDVEVAFQRRPRGTRTSRRREIKVPLILSGSLVSEGVLGGPLLRRPGLDQSCRALLAGAPRLPLPLAVSKVLLPQPHQPISLILPLSALSHRLPSRPKMFIVISCLSPLFLSYPGVLNPQPVGKRNKRRAIHKTIYFSRKKKSFTYTASIVN